MNDLARVPPTIDGARVLKFADARGLEPTGYTRHFVDGQQVGRFSGLAICTYGDEKAVCLFYCDDTWHTVTDTLHESVDAAIGQARQEFGPVRFEDLGSD